MTMKSKIEQEPFLWIDLEINDFDHFAEIVHSWDIDFLQLDGGTFHSKLKHNGEDISMYQFNYTMTKSTSMMVIMAQQY